MTRIEYLVANPNEVEKSDIPLLKKEVEKYPYFYTLRALLLYGLKKENHPSFEDYLNRTSIQSSNRVDLYNYINPKPIEKETSTQEIIDENVIIEGENIVNTNTDTILEDEIIDSEPLIKNKETNLENNLIEENEIIETENNKDSEVIIEDEPEEILEGFSDNDEVIEENNPEIEVENTSIISDDELAKVAVITNEVVETSTLEDEKTSEIDIANAVQQTSGIEVIQEKEDQPEEILEGFSNNDEVIEENNPEIDSTISDDSTFSFSDWLKKVPSQSKDQKTLDEEQEIAEREIKYKLIDDFLEKNPKIVPMKKTDITPVSTPANFVHNSEEYSDLMTETLAQIYIEQKKYDKAIKAYKILILKYPEKNSLFANRIKGIENLKNSK